MKRIMILFLTIFILTGASLASYSETVRFSAIPSVRIIINSGGLTLGEALSSDASEYVSVSNNKYYVFESAIWVDDISRLSVGDEPRIRVTLEAVPRRVSHQNYTEEYIFRGSYNSSNVTVINGTFSSASVRDSGNSLVVTLRSDEIKGPYTSPQNADWNSVLGTASWRADSNDSGYYDILLYRDSTLLKRLYTYRGRSYNFYPYMTKEGEYFYRIRTVPGPNDSVGKASNWIDSSSLYISSNEVSDGSGQTTSDTYGGSSSAYESSGSVASGAVTSIDGVDLGDSYGWINIANNWYFRYPDKTLATGWLKLNDKYYRFDTDGSMQTGWILNPYGQWYYLNPTDGVMVTGWLNISGTYYYLDSRDYECQGMMLTGVQNIGGRIYYFDSSGAMQTGWIHIGDGYYYFYPEGSTGGEFGYLASNTYIGYFYVGADGAWRAS